MDIMKNELINFNRSCLKQTATKIYYLDGSAEICRIDSGETIISTKGSGYCSGFIKQIDPDLTCDEIIPSLYLSGHDVACCFELLKKKSITHILNITKNVDNLYEKENIIYKRIFVDDLPTVNIAEYFNGAFEFIDNALLFSNQRSSNNVLVHCNAGVSRSASFVIGYLIKKRMFGDYKTVYDHVKSCRSKIFPNKGFVQQLKKYEKDVNGI
jgi:atypical dual specificity phosphatase